MLVVVLNSLCPVRLSLLLYCIYFCFSVPNKTISISISKMQECMKKTALNDNTVSEQL